MAVCDQSEDPQTRNLLQTFMDIQNLITGLLALLMFCFCMQRRKARINKDHRVPPEARGGWPILGHLQLLAGPKVPHITLGAMTDKHGPIFTVRLGLYPALVINDSKAAKECFTINDADVSSRPKLVGAQLMGYDNALFGFSPYGTYWREVRKICVSQLLSNTRIEFLKLILESEIEAFLKELKTLWTMKKNRNSRGDILVDMKILLQNLTFNMVLRMVAGKRYSVVFSKGLKEEKEAREFQEAINECFHLLGLFVVRDAIPFLGWMDIKRHEKAMKKAAKRLDVILSAWLEEHRLNRASNEGVDGVLQQDFIDVMDSLLDGRDLEGRDADSVIKATSMTMMAGGGDTSAITLIWALSLLLNNPHVLRKAQEELDIHVGKNRQVSSTDLKNLVYIQAIIKETLRLYPAAPLSAQRLFTRDCTIGGYKIKKGTKLIVNLWKIHRDPEVWPNPSEFIPERFLSTHKDVDVRGQHFELIPFGSGRRACAGISLGVHMVHLTLASILHAFDMSTMSNAPVDMTESFGLTNLKATPLEVMLKPRS